MTYWQLPPKLNIPADLLAFVGDPLLAQLLVRRGFNTLSRAQAFLDPTAYKASPPEILPDMFKAVTRLRQAIQRQELMAVWGDFDVDGQTSTTLLVSVLRSLGARVHYYIPHRLTESHGIKLPALKKIVRMGVKLIVTCDTGTTEHEMIATAHAVGVDVIVTDHHDLGDTLPPAQAVINPKRLPPNHPLHELPGVGVAYKLAEALIETDSKSALTLESLLDLVALGIVADVAKLTGDSRYLLQRGLPVLSQTQRLGLQVLIENANLKVDRLTEEHIGFWLAPRLNALGRLGDANLAVELLTTADLSRARILATQLEGLNDQRKLLVEQVIGQAEEQLKQNPSLAKYNAIILAAADWHPGVMGLAASQLVGRYGKPTILIALSPNNGETVGQGSARSVPSCDIHQAIKTQADLLIHFGGHPMAAGLAISPDKIANFRRGVSEVLTNCYQPGETELSLDAFVELNQLSADLLKSIQRLAPFGNGNPAVQLGCHNLRIVKETIFGKRHDHKRVVVQDEKEQQQEIIWWSGATEPLPVGMFDLAFTIGTDDYAGGESIQVTWLAVQSLEAVSVTVKPQFVDWRHLPHPELEIGKQRLPVVWGEGVSVAGLSLLSRDNLPSAESLVIWTAPSSETVFQQIIATVRPRRVFLVGQVPPFDSPLTFISQLMGLLKYAMQQRNGEVQLEQLAAALGHDVATIRWGINWLAAQGKLTTSNKNGMWVVQTSQQPANQIEATMIEQYLKSALTEAVAYRKFFLSVSLSELTGISYRQDHTAMVPLANLRGSS